MMAGKPKHEPNVRAALTIGPLLFHWPAAKRRDFLFRIADEAPVEAVYVGEVVCAKREPFFDPVAERAVDRLMRAGKRVLFSTLAQVTTALDRKAVARTCARGNGMVEANDASALGFLKGRPHAIGPFLNVYNAESLGVLARDGAVHVTVPPELPAQAVAVLARAADDLGVTVEVQAYGRIPLALSARCYHARAHGRIKDNCQFVCEGDADGLPLTTLDNQPAFAINGIQTLSYPYLNLMQEVRRLREVGVSAFRLSPHDTDMVAVARAFRDVLDGAREPAAALVDLQGDRTAAPFVNGFYHGTEGYRWIAAGGRPVSG
jgi:collagenase-like PrtC family protease